MEITHFGNIDSSKNRKCSSIKGESKRIKVIRRIIEENPEGIIDGAAEDISDGGLKLEFD
jgi:hypothetical protein